MRQLWAVLNKRVSRIIGSTMLASIFILGSAATYIQTCAPVGINASSPMFLPWPQYGQAALSVQGDSTIFAHGIAGRLPMASTAKLITALTVLQKYPLKAGQMGPKILFTKNDVDRYYFYQDLDGSVVPVVEGQGISEYDALRALLMPSANNIADTLAIWAYGNLTNYMYAANAYIKQQGLNSTSVGTDASGLSPSSTSTATDLVLLGKIILDTPILAAIVSQQKADIQGMVTVVNTNKLLGVHGVIGIKTGNSDSDKGVYLFATKQHVVGGADKTVIGSIMGAPSMTQAFSDALPLAAFVAQGQSW